MADPAMEAPRRTHDPSRNANAGRTRIANRFSGREDNADVVRTNRDYRADSAPSGLRESCDGARDHGARG
jgi:hypothetical protein